MDFADIVKSIADQNNRVAFHFGVVTAKTNGNTRISVRVSGGTTVLTGIRYLHSYAPQVDDVVLLLVNKGDIIGLGDLA
jgi:hypothetical protein